MTPFGCKRNNITKINSTKILSESSDAVLPKFTAQNKKGASQKDITAIGAKRNVIVNVQNKEGMFDNSDPKSEKFLSKWSTPNPMTKVKQFN